MSAKGTGQDTGPLGVSGVRLYNDVVLLEIKRLADGEFSTGHAERRIRWLAEESVLLAELELKAAALLLDAAAWLAQRHAPMVDTNRGSA